ncbi:LysR family transcriptional regulator [Planctomycetota bacterium]
METLSLRTFVCVADSQGFTKAADSLYLTQPAISKRIAALEQELGAKLFDRIGKKTLLTDAGKVLYQRAQNILVEVDDCQRTLASLSETVAGRLALGISHHIGLHRLPPILRQYSNTFPDVDLDIQFLYSESACEGVERGTFEIALITLPNHPADILSVLPIWNDPFTCVTAKGHALMTKRRRNQQITATTLAKHPAILPGSGTFTRALIDAAFKKQGVSLNVKLATNFLETIKMMVTAGLGWSVLPQSMSQDPELVCLTVKGIKLSRSLGLVRHRKRTLSNAAREMINLLAHHSDLS